MSEIRNSGEPVPAPASDATQKPQVSFSLGSIMVIMVVAAFVGAIVERFYNASNDLLNAETMGHFALAAVVGPSAILIVVGTAFKVINLIMNYRSPVTLEDDGPHGPDGF